MSKLTNLLSTNNIGENKTTKRCSCQYDIFSADDKQIGYEFQYLCFINELLKLKINQKISYEVKDDIHIETNSGKSILIQVKFTSQKNVQNKPINLTEKSIDLWKTLSNWVKIITDESLGRNEILEQIKFLNNTTFVLLTNKDLTNNMVIKKIMEYKEGKLSEELLSKYLNEIEKESGQTILPYIKEVQKLDLQVLKKFVVNIKCRKLESDIYNELNSSIRNMMVSPNRVNDVLKDLYFELKKDFFDKVLNGTHQTISRQEFLDKYTICFQKNNTTTLLYRTFKPQLPPNLIEQKFIKELIEIGEIDPIEDVSQIEDYTAQMLTLNENLAKWHNDGDITSDIINNFHRNAFFQWRNQHKYSHLKTANENEDKYNALDCLSEIRKIQLKILNLELEISSSNGEYYHLANDGKIGWKRHWRKMYNEKL